MSLPQRIARAAAAAPGSEYTEVDHEGTWRVRKLSDGTVNCVLMRAGTGAVRTATNSRLAVNFGRAPRAAAAAAERNRQEQLRRCARQILARGTKQQAKAVLAQADRDVIARATQRLQRAQRNRLAADVFERTGAFPD